MSCYDEIRCECPLPDGFDLGLGWWQTNAPTLDQSFTKYVITRKGKLMLWDPEGLHTTTPALEDFHADLEFYQDNVTAFSSTGYYTANDEPVWMRKYVARFTNGQLTRITGGEVEHKFGEQDHLLYANIRKGGST